MHTVTTFGTAPQPSIEAFPPGDADPAAALVAS